MNRSDDTAVLMIPYQTWGLIPLESRKTIIAYSVSSGIIPGKGPAFEVGRSRVEEIEQLLLPARAGAEQTPPVA